MEYRKCLTQWLDLISYGQIVDNEIMVKILAKFPEFVNYTNYAGETMLHGCYRSIEVRDLLINHGADPNITNNQGYTVLDKVLAAGNVPSLCVLRLLQVGAKIQRYDLILCGSIIQCFPIFFEYKVTAMTKYGYSTVIRWAVDFLLYCTAYELIRLKGIADDYYHAQSLLERSFYGIFRDDYPTNYTPSQFVEGLVFPIRMLKSTPYNCAIELLYEFI
jgi:hypothetical protein